MNILGDGSGGGSGGQGGMAGGNQYGSFLNPYQNSASPAGSSTQPYGAGGFGFGQGSPSSPFGVASGATTGQPNWYGSTGTPAYPGAQTGGYGGFYPSPGGVPTSVPSTYQAGSGYLTGTTYDPALTGDLFGYLQSQVGQQGQMYPGQLTSAPNDIYGQMQSFLTGGQSSIPGMSNLSNIAQTGGGINVANTPGYAGLSQMAATGDPINVMPEWQSMVAAMQQNTEQGAANLKEQMAAGGNLVGTPYGTSMQDYYANIGSQQQALLGQLSTQAQQQAVQNQLAAQGQLTQFGLQGQEQNVANQLAAAGQIGGYAGQTAQQIQGINQLGATNAYQEWLRSQPQYSPLLPYMLSAGTTFPSYLTHGASSSPLAGVAEGAGMAAGQAGTSAIIQQLGKG